MAKGIKVEGEGEWHARKHGGAKRRVRHAARTGGAAPLTAQDPSRNRRGNAEVRAVEITGSHIGDAPVLPELLNQIPAHEQIGSVTADGAFDTRRCHTAIIECQAAAIIPIRKNGRPSKEDCPAAIARNETLRATRHYGRAFWKRWTGYHVRSRIEAKMPSQVRSNLWR